MHSYYPFDYVYAGQRTHPNPITSLFTDKMVMNVLTKMMKFPKAKDHHDGIQGNATCLGANLHWIRFESTIIVPLIIAYGIHNMITLQMLELFVKWILNFNSVDYIGF